MSISKRRLKANRANAKKSTGPVTEAGKAAVAQNSRKHGLTGRFFVVEGENQDKFEALLNQLIEDEKPVGIAEVELVKKMAQHTWCSDRAARMQEGCFQTEYTEQQGTNVMGSVLIHPELERFMRYQSFHNREYERASKELLSRREKRLKVENGFALQKRVEAAEIREIQVHELKVATAQRRLDLIENQLSKKTAAAPRQIEAFEPPENRKIAA